MGAGPSAAPAPEEAAAAPNAAPNATVQPDTESSDGNSSDSEFELAEEHADDAVDETAAAPSPAAAQEPNPWQRNDSLAFSQRVKTLGDDPQYKPKLNLEDYASKGIFEYAKHFLPMVFLAALAAKMEANGKAKHDQKVDDYANWTVPVDDVLQWIGAWMYRLAFPQQGGIESYFNEAVQSGRGKQWMGSWGRAGHAIGAVTSRSN